MGQPTITPAIAASSTAAPNLQTTSSGTVHASRDGQPLCPTRARTGYAETNLAVMCKHCLKLTAGLDVEPVQPQEVSSRVSPLTLSNTDQGQTFPQRSLKDLSSAANAGCAEVFPVSNPDSSCAPWCVEHDPDGDICSAPNLEAGDGYGGVVGLTNQLDEGLRIHLDQVAPLSLEEGKTLACAILGQVALAEQAMRGDVVRPTFAPDRLSVANDASGPARPGCKSWCVDHDHDALDEFGGSCFGENLPIPGSHSYDLPTMQGCVGINWHPSGRGPLIELFHNSDAALTLDEAEQVAHVLLKQVAAGRERPAALPGDAALTAAFQTGMLTAIQCYRELGLDRIGDLTLNHDALSGAEVAEVVAALRWIILKRQMADVYPATGPAVAA